MVRPDHARGVILSSGSLVLQRVRRRSAGNYTCVASNVEGDTASNPVKLNVMCESRILNLKLPIATSRSKEEATSKHVSVMAGTTSGIVRRILSEQCFLLF